jgi:hypothetical protein
VRSASLRPVFLWTAQFEFQVNGQKVTGDLKGAIKSVLEIAIAYA